jgi:hypothetical protein
MVIIIVLTIIIQVLIQVKDPFSLSMAQMVYIIVLLLGIFLDVDHFQVKRAQPKHYSSGKCESPKGQRMFMGSMGLKRKKLYPTYPKKRGSSISPPLIIGTFQMGRFSTHSSQCQCSKNYPSNVNKAYEQAYLNLRLEDLESYAYHLFILENYGK